MRAVVSVHTVHINFRSEFMDYKPAYSSANLVALELAPVEKSAPRVSSGHNYSAERVSSESGIFTLNQ